MKIYYFILIDYKGQEVEESAQKFGSAKHCAFSANEAVNSIPPCAGFKIRYDFISSHQVAKLVSEH